ncbi:MAG: hypothetical protein RLZZ28_2625 [Bacteroidota bacterium]
MRVFWVISSMLFSSALFGQYYFNDIIAIQRGNDQYRLLRSNKIKRIKATSFEPDNSITDGFALEEEISLDGKKIIQSTALSSGKSSVTTRNYEAGKLKSTQSTNNGIESKNEIKYHETGLVQRVTLTTTDTSMKEGLSDVHEWNYDAAGKIAFMLKIKNKTDTLYIEFTKDEAGNIIEEKWKKKNRVTETYYYYYDQKNQLTDIVRYNTRLKKLLPDFQYEYDSNGRIIQMTQFSLSLSNYLIWKYTYSDKGLKLSENGFDKEKKLIGRIQYQYE